MELPFELEQPLLEEARCFCQSLDAFVVRNELRVVVAHGQDATRLEAYQGYATLYEGQQQIQVSLGVLSRLIHQSLREHGPAATDDLGQVYPRPYGGEEPHGLLPYLGPLVLVPGVIEQGDLSGSGAL